MNYIKIVLIIFFMMIISEKSFSQYECPPDEAGCSAWVLDTLVTTTEYPTCDLVVIYKYRICYTTYQFYIVDKYTTGNCEDMEELWNDPHYLSSFNEWLNILMMEEWLKNQPGPPSCPATALKVTFYEASCVVAVKCTYEVVPASRECEEDFLAPYPEYEDEGVSKVDIWKLQSCGVTCCKKTYSICQEVGTNGSYIKIELLSKEKVGECTNPDEFSKPCTDGC